MSQYPFLPLFTDAFIADTGHLSAAETGAYLMLIMVAWRSPGCRLPDDDNKLARWARVDRRTWLRIKPTVMEFWALENGFWSQKRLTKEHDVVSKRAEVARDNGKHGGRPKSLKNNEPQNPEGSSWGTQKKAPIPIPIQKEEPIADAMGESAREPAPPPPSAPVEPISKTKPRKVASRIDPDRQPDDRDRAFVADHDLPPSQARHEWDKFVAFHAAKGSLMLDWHAAWRTWVLRCQDRPPPPVAATPKKSVQDAALDQLNRYLAGDRHDDRVLTLPARNRPSTDDYFDGLLSARRG